MSNHNPLVKTRTSMRIQTEYCHFGSLVAVCCTPVFHDIVHKLEHFLFGRGLEQGDACLSEVV